MAYAQIPNPNQRRVQPATLTMHHTGPYYQQPLSADPQLASHTNPGYPQQTYPPQSSFQPNLGQWQQQAATYNNAQRYSHSPQEPQASLSPPTSGYSQNGSYLSPSPHSPITDSASPWSAPGSAAWITPHESPIMGSSGWKETTGIAPGEMVWDTRIPSQAPPIQKSVSDNEPWAIQTARAKKLRTEEKDKAKVGACKHCKRLKMKCTFEPPGAASCQRCRSSGQECIVEGRKPRKNSEPLELLASQIDDKQEIIDGLLRIISRPRGPENAQPSSTAAETAEVWKWIERAARSLMSAPSGEEPDNAEEERLPADSAPFGLLAELSLNEPDGDDKSTGKTQTKQGTSQADADDAEVGVASAAYFRPGPMAHPELRRIIVERQMVPEVLTIGVVTEEDVEHLFRIFHERIDAVIAIIDPVIHTVAGVKARCPFLFTVICAIASRYWIERPELYSILMHHARSAAAMAITDGWKSLEVCQAYLLLSVYPQHARSWAEDRSWLYLGCAIRLAMDLNLYKQGTRTFVNEAHEREVLNRTRTWLICFNMDRALATKLGRPTTIPEDYIVRHSREWWRRSKFNGRLDVHLCYYTQLLRTVTRYFSLIYSDPESLSGFNESTEFGPITRAFDDEMEQFRQDAEHAYSTAPESRHPASLYRLALMPLAVAYYRLVMYSFGLEHAHKSASEPGNMFLTRSIDTASEVLRITNEDLPIWEFHRYSPDGHWMWSVFAAAFLIKLAKPRSPQPPHLTMSESQRESSLLLVRQFITTLERSAVDDRHSPALYARFLRRTLGEPVEPSRKTPSSPPASTGAPKARVTFSPGPSEQGSGEDVLAAMYSLTGEFWDNALLPGTWGIPGTGRGM